MTTNRMITIFCILCACLIALIQTGSGVQISGDSMEYLNAAYVVQLYGGIPADYGVFPPLYPMVLSPFPDLLTGARILNVIAVALTIAIALRALRPHGNTLALIAVSGALLLSPSIMWVNQWAWSEPLFIVLVAAFFALVADARRRVLLLAMVVALACLQRYVGILLIPVGLIALYMNRARWRDLIVFALIAVLPISVWMLRNVALGNSPMGSRGDPQFDLITSAAYAISTLATWLPLLAGVALAGWATRAQIPRTVALTSALYAIVHIAFIVYSAATTRIDTPDQRLLAPAYIPLLLTMIAVGGFARTHFRVRERRFAVHRHALSPSAD